MLLLTCLLAVIGPHALGLEIETKLDLPSPIALVSGDSQHFTMDSSLSPKIVKAFYEINFVQIPKPISNEPHVTLTDSKGCQYSKELCKLYFAPTKVSVVQKVDDLIQGIKKDTDVPIIEGITVTDEEKFLKELNPKIPAQRKRNKALSKKTTENDDVPVFRGTVNVEGIMNTPEVSTLPDYQPRYPEIKRQCFQGACWRTYY